MKVDAKYNNGKPYMTLWPENELDEKIMNDCLHPDVILSGGGYGFSGGRDYFNISVKPWRKSLKQRIAMVFHPKRVKW